MKLPKLYAPVNIKFSSLRHGIGSSGGVTYDNDVFVIRKCRRVLSPCFGGWKWQIVDAKKIYEFDYNVAQDKEVLDFIGSELEIEFV
jgi:hypothetical protein